MSSTTLILAARNSEGTYVCAAVGVALVLALYIWAVFQERNALRSEAARLKRALEATEQRAARLKADMESARQQAAQLESSKDRELLRAVSEAATKVAAVQAEKEHEVAQIVAARDRAIAVAKEDADRRILEAKRIHDQWAGEINGMCTKLESLVEAFRGGFLKGRKWLGLAYEDFLAWQDEQHQLGITLTARPLTQIADDLLEVKAQRRSLAAQVKMLQWQIASYEEYFPQLADYRDAILDEAVDLRRDAADSLEAIDPAIARGYLSRAEFDSLSRSEKFQLALERYRNRSRTPWEVGRDYERQIGFGYECDGWHVRYQGALDGFEDLGRDLVCERGQEVIVIQCKCWREERLIRERHLMQLYGTTILKQIQLGRPDCRVKAVLVTTGKLSDVASKVAADLDIEVRKIPQADYPMIKCNVSATTGERIYHLPFDQQYDRVIIGDQEGEFYARTIQEAEGRGFRRAQRWTGQP